MQARIVERVESWDSRPFTGGVRELHELADADFSGAVSVGGTWLFLLNGRVIGVFGGDVEDVADADGTTYEAPHESLALLYSMQQRGGETQAKYYTNDTPLSEASQTLSDASFTGYVELSENVLSGDYYVVYYGGRSMSAAFVGASEELITGDEAFERADDEVGVYEVMKAPVSVTELPPLDDEDDAATEAAGAAGASDDDPADEADTGTALSTGNGATEDDGGAADASADDPSDADSTRTEPGAGTDDAPSADESRSRPGDGSGSTDQTTPAGGAAADAGRSAEPERAPDGSTAGGPRAAVSGDESVAANDGGAATQESDKAFDEEREWRKTTSVPTIDPADSKGGEDADAAGSGSSRSKAEKSSRSTKQSSGSRQKRSRTGGKSTVEKLKQAVKQREQKLQAASERIDSLEGDRDDLQDRVSALEAERDELQAEVEDLEAELAAAEASGGDEPSATDLNPVDALSDTNLFVRYDSKGKPTLDELDRTTDPDAVNENLRIDHHTQFDAESATVDGEPFESFLHETTVYRFVSWAVRALPYEVRDSGHQSGLADLYEALPRVDRAELNGTVAVEPDEETSVSRTFDVVLRDRMGNPLVVADVNTGRDPVTGDQMDALVSDATAIREGSDDLSAAMYVTGSFFEPAALETADEETAGGGFLSRSDRESFVKVGRKAGYHLCLVEDRNDAFHLTVPEL